MLEEVCASKGMDYKQFAEGLKKKEQWHVEARHPPSAFSFAMTQTHLPLVSLAGPARALGVTNTTCSMSACKAVG